MTDGLGGNLKAEPIAILDALDDLKAMVRLDTTLQQPKTVVESHGAKRVGRQLGRDMTWTGREAYMLKERGCKEGTVRPASVRGTAHH